MTDLLKRTSLIRREIFDPKNKEHVDSLKIYLRTGNWGEVQFYAELPYIEVPVTVMRKYLAHTLKVVPETMEETAARLQAKNLVRPATQV